jgi:6-phosphogluconolactonase/glucosamine-6-phosphate isomerase/deaminase
MRFIKGGPEEAIAALANSISSALEEGETLWLVCGGSNIPYAVEAMRIVRERSSGAALARLTIALTDERYGPVGHVDSNWRQLQDAGLDMDGVNTVTVLTGAPLAETVEAYEKRVGELFARTRAIAQFGIGADGHIAGVLPHTGGASSDALVCGYEAGPYTRVTLTLFAIERIHAAYALVFGAGKRDMLERLQHEDGPLADMPAQVLKRLPEAYLYSDQIA